MKPDQIKALERRNTMKQEQLDRIEEIVMENHRALRGSNGDAGLVADVVILKNASKNRVWRDRAIFVAGLAITGDIVLHLI